MTGEKRSRAKWVLAIYAFAFLFFVFKMLFYSQYVARFPDEIQHISYIAYLEETHALVPDFRSMTVLVQDSGLVKPDTDLHLANLETLGRDFTFGTETNYLGHPPLYYQVMRLSRAVEVQGDHIVVHILRLRLFTIAFSALAMLLILYIGYTRIGRNPYLHALYTAAVVSVPMLAYECAGVNNDSMALFGLSVFLLGLLRYSEKRRNTGTYLLIGAGVFVSFLSKLTAGMIVLIAYVLYFLFLCVREKNARLIFSRKFLAALPLYLAVAAYHLAVYVQLGSILPTYRNIDPQGFYHSIFYVPAAQRTHMGFAEYTAYYFKKFFGSWTGIGSYIVSGRAGGVFSVNRIAVFSLWVLPLALLLLIGRRGKHASGLFALLAVYFGLAGTAVIQWLRAYHEYADVSGYLGGFQSRYYLCGIAALALAVTALAGSGAPAGAETERLRAGAGAAGALPPVRPGAAVRVRAAVFRAVCLAFVGLLFYEDFVYFLLHFKNYL